MTLRAGDLLLAGFLLFLIDFESDERNVCYEFAKSSV